MIILGIDIIILEQGQRLLGYSLGVTWYNLFQVGWT